MELAVFDGRSISLETTAREATLQDASAADTFATPRILVVDDDTHLRELLQLSFEAKGYEVQSAPDGSQAIEILVDFAPALVLLDILLPGDDGFVVCQQIRAISNVPIVIFSALNSADDISRALTSAGADEYVVKPCSIKELESRVDGVLRRAAWLDAPPELSIISHGDIKLSADTQDVVVAGRTIALTPIEYKLLHFLMMRADSPVPRHILAQHIWNLPLNKKARVLHTNVFRLRKKIELDPTNPQYLQTVQGIGYKFCSTPQTVAPATTAQPQLTKPRHNTDVRASYRVPLSESSSVSA